MKILKNGYAWLRSGGWDLQYFWGHVVYGCHLTWTKNWKNIYLKKKKLTYKKSFDHFISVILKCFPALPSNIISETLKGKEGVIKASKS
jgi:hypothetical protein